MLRINGLLKIFIALLLTFSLTGFLCDDESDDELDCAGAGTNAAEILWIYHSGNQIALCDDLYDNFGVDWDGYQDCLDISDWTEQTVINRFIQWCKEEWTDDDVSCVKAANTRTDLLNCD
jgi:hypothetical protein